MSRFTSIMAGFWSGVAVFYFLPDSSKWAAIPIAVFVGWLFLTA
jgi:hypothetical protein